MPCIKDLFYKVPCPFLSLQEKWRLHRGQSGRGYLTYIMERIVKPAVKQRATRVEAIDIVSKSHPPHDENLDLAIHRGGNPRQVVTTDGGPWSLHPTPY